MTRLDELMALADEMRISDTPEKPRAALASALSELVADAERYAWICDGNGYFLEEQAISGDKPEVDAAIDAARQQEAK